MLRSPILISVFVGGLVIALTFAAVPLLRDTLYYRHVVMKVSDDMRLEFIHFGLVDRRACERDLATALGAIEKNCGTCRILEKECLKGLSDEQLRLLSGKPVNMPSARLPDGVVAYISTNREAALAACKESERQSAQAAPGKRVRCYPPGTPRVLGRQEVITPTPPRN
jgi:hypothetical protein